MSDAGKDLLAAVLAAPDDDEPRYAYGDYLTEQGDPRGEFIQLQCVLKRRLRGARGRTWEKSKWRDHDPAELEKRERVLLKKNQKAWLAPIRTPIRTWTWSRGFVETVVADAAKFLAAVDVIFAQTPLTGVELTALSAKLLEAYAAHPTVRKLRSLDVTNQRITPELAVHFRAPVWGGLEALSIGGNPLEEAGVEALAQSPSLKGLRTLTLSGTALSDEAVQSLTKATFFRSLRELYLGWNGRGGLSPRAIEYICEAGESLEVLSIPGMRLGDAVALAVAEAPKLRNLRRLRLDRWVTKVGVDAILHSPHLKQLRALDDIPSELFYGAVDLLKARHGSEPE